MSAAPLPLEALYTPWMNMVANICSSKMELIFSVSRLQFHSPECDLKGTKSDRYNAILFINSYFDIDKLIKCIHLRYTYTLQLVY